MRAWLSSWVLGMAAAGAALPALAQQMRLEPAAAAGCMVSIDKDQPVPVYPLFQFKAGKPGRVLAQFEFKGPGSGPVVTVLERSGELEFAEAVQAHARSLRVPCLQPSESVLLRQEFVFQPDDRQVYGARPMQPPDPRHTAMLRCIVNGSDQKSPPFPDEASRRGVQGNVLANLRFIAADQPPQVKLFHRPAAKVLGRGVEDWVRSLRMPCHEGGPVAVTVLFSFRFEGEASGFKQMSLQQLLPVVEGIQDAPLQLDTTAMGCPFEIRLLYRQPFMRNVASSVGDANPARWPLLQWLESIRLNLPEQVQDTVFADTADITVPCLKIDFKPKEKSS